MADKSHASPELEKKVAVFHQALQSYRNREWKEALDTFSKIKGDELSALYIARIERLMKNPPPDDWSGVHELTQK
jgi:adenylate cyclase